MTLSQAVEEGPCPPCWGWSLCPGTPLPAPLQLQARAVGLSGECGAAVVGCHCNDLAYKKELAVLVQLVSAAEACEGDKGQLGVVGGIDQAHNLV